MDRETLAARLHGRPRVALDPQSPAGLDIRQPATATEAKCDGFGSRAVVAMAQEAHAQTDALIGIWAALDRIAAALERRETTPTQPHP